MPWYFYSGNTAVPVRRIDGEIVSVRPRSHIEAKPEDVRKFGVKMSRCAPPKGVSPPPPPQAPPAPEEIRPSNMAKAIKEIGGSIKDASMLALSPAAPAQQENEVAAKQKSRRSKPKSVTPDSPSSEE